MPHERLKPDTFLDRERLNSLKNLVPEAFVDGKINWNSLKESLGGELEDTEKSTEHFGLFWPGKQDARKQAGKPSKGTLIPVKGEGIDEDFTGNIFIEGENLEVLKILHKSYAGRIKMVYIDPPYNTGNDFVYDDDFTEPIDVYLKNTGQIDGEGQPMTTNKKADGRFHSKWLSMMYPRLRLARELLRDDGVIFVSIDDNEVHHLRMLMNEVFGEENFIASFIWKRRQNADSRNISNVSVDHEYIVVFSKVNGTKFQGEQIDITKYKNPDNDPRGPWASIDLSGLATKDQRPNLHFDIIDPNTGWVFPPNPNRGWSKSKENIEKMISEGRILFPKTPDGRPREKKFLNDLRSNVTGFSSWLDPDKTGYTTSGTRIVTELFDGKYFDFPKSLDLLKVLLSQISDENNSHLILDFFAGSATTAHAVLKLNEEDGGNRKFILVQLPEQMDEKSEAYRAGYKNIAEIAKERIHRVIKNLRGESAEKLEKKGLKKEKELFDVEVTKTVSANGRQDFGFKVFKLAPSHYKPWENYHGESIEKVEELFDEYQVPLVSSWREVEDGLFTEVLLLEGYPLNSVVTERAELKNNRVRQVECAFHANCLVVCLDDKISQKTIDTLNLADGDTFVCLDTAIDDQSKSRLADKGMIKTI